MMEGAPTQYDVAILGGGLAGLTLALQLKRQRPETSVLVAEKRVGPAPEAAFKVGESTVEISAHYFDTICGLKDHLDSEQLSKAGLRFFFPAGENNDITQRVEWGDRSYNPVPTYQLDRGRFENELAARCIAHGVDLRQGAFIDDVEIGEDGHSMTFVTGGPGGDRTTVRARWLVDCAGRSFILKRKLGLDKPNEHTINSAWFRLGNGLLDLEEWGAHDQAWMARMERPGIRRYSTNHLTGEGYWVWLIPLASNSHSIGVVADPRFHPFEELSTFDSTLDWLRRHEPQLAAAVDERRDDVQDFLKIEDFSHSATRVFSPQRWSLTGESGVFIDPLYSPGSDYIAIANTFTGDLIKRDLDGENITERAEAFNNIFLLTAETAINNVWKDHYSEFGDAEVFSAKLSYDYVSYWGILTPRMHYDKFTDLPFTQRILPDVQRGLGLGGRVQQLFRDWHALGQPENPTGLHAVTSTFDGMFDRLRDLVAGLDDDEVHARLRLTLEIQEGMAVMLLHKAARRLPDGAPDPERRINPYAVSVHPERWEEDGLFSDTGLTLAEARERSQGYERMLLDELALVAAG
jgi:flavin-dependent dehydrogenase